MERKRGMDKWMDGRWNESEMIGKREGCMSR